MKKQGLLLCVLWIGCSLFAQSASGQDSLVVATFNCEFLTKPKVHIKFGLPFNLNGEQKEQWDQPGFRDQKFTEAAQAVAEVLDMVNADVFALTEVGDDTDVAELQAELNALGGNYPHRAVGDSRDFTTRQHVAVLSRFPLSNVVPQISGREIYIQEPDDPETEDDTGISKGMRVTISAHEKEFLLYVIHLASERGGHDQDQQRIAQASVVRRHYLPALRKGALIIVAGDLNDKRGQPTIQRIRGLDDIDGDLIQTGLVDFFDDDKLDTRWTYEFQGIRQQIDHLLLSFSIKDVSKRGGIRTRTVEHGNLLASDHHPLVVTLRLRDE